MIKQQLMRLPRKKKSEIHALVAGNLRPSDQQGIEALILQAGILPISTQPVASADVVDESPALTAAVQRAEVIDIELFRRSNQHRSAVSATLGSNAAAQLAASGTLGSNAAVISAQETKEAA
jgi:Tfp pilus assembly protein PilN